MPSPTNSMERLSGETLAECLQNGPLPLDQALTVAAEIPMRSLACVGKR